MLTTEKIHDDCHEDWKEQESLKEFCKKYNVKERDLDN
jgi:hypothetical protein